MAEFAGLSGSGDNRSPDSHDSKDAADHIFRAFQGRHQPAIVTNARLRRRVRQDASSSAINSTTPSGRPPNVCPLSVR
jgi:hypothetical protein